MYIFFQCFQECICGILIGIVWEEENKKTEKEVKHLSALELLSIFDILLCTASLKEGALVQV